MNLREIIMDAIKFPISDTRKFLIFCALIIIMSLSTVLPSYGVKDSTLSLILTLVTLIVAIIVLGYCVEVIKSGADGDDTLPDFDYVKQFVNGIKALILDIIYFIIPAIITIIVASATGLFTSFTKIVYISIDAMSKNANNLTTIMAAVPKTTMNTFTNALTITLIVAIILFIIFSLMSFTGLVTLIVIYIIAFVLSLIIGLIGLIPYIGVFIGIFVGVPFMLLFLYRAIGLLYADA